MGRRFFRDRQYFHGGRARFMYELMGKYFADAEHWRFMNYGYAFEDEADALTLNEADMFERYNAQLYHIVAAQTDLTGLDVLDVGSGRGGGASYVQRYLGPATTTGMDLAESAVAFCNKVHGGIEGLRYVQGDAQAMPFEDESFDVVINVESAHCYPDKPAFLAEVMRVLRPGGSFFYTDFTAAGQPHELDLPMAGFEQCVERDVTAGIVKALTVDDVRRKQEIVENVPLGLRWLGNLWSGRPGSWIYKDFEDGRRQYLVCRADKPGGVPVGVLADVREPAELRV